MLTGSELAITFTDLWTLLLYTSYSLLRMFVALFTSYAFAIPYGIVAARSRRAERVLMPILDILQSVPILGFFPAAIFFFIAFFHETWIGVELAAIFLIFTSQAWNLAFAVYESVSAIPADLEEASASLRLRGLVRIKRLYLPACLPKIVYNGMMSWAGGWYFLVAAEIITLGSRQYSLPGIGRYLAEATYNGNYLGTVLGLAVLVSTILVVDITLWRPLREYAERFKYEAISSERASHYTLFHASGFAWLKSHLRVPLPIADVKRLIPIARFVPFVKHGVHISERSAGVLERHVKMLALVVGLLLLSGLLTLYAPMLLNLYSSVQTFFEDLLNPAITSEVSLIPAALGSSILRLFLAYSLSVAWTLPLAVKIADGGKALGTSTFTILEILASIPATALFPVIILATLNLPGGLQLTSIILTMTGMQWYLLFNLIGGVRSIPIDLIEVSQTYRVRGLERWRKLLLPAILPSFVTGSITAWGGGWNALIVSEYVVFGREVLSVSGIGAMLDRAAYELGSSSLLIVSIVVMVATVFAMNRLLWRRLYHLVLSRYRMDY
ncbi:MAG: ABC transporter permease subunit [Nitrososphaerales archaeon]